MIDTAFWYFLLLVAVAAGSGYVGWRAAHAYLEGAQAVLHATRSVAEMAGVLDKTREELASSRVAGELHRRAMEASFENVRGAVEALLHAFQQFTGSRGTASRTPGRQVGEASPE